MPNVLVVDDSVMDRRRAGGLIQKDETWQVAYAEDGPSAVAAIAALVILGLFGLLLLFPSLADRATRPLVALGARLSQNAGQDGGGSSFLSSLLLGVATGLLWAPCAGPVLGLLLTGAALNGASAQTSLLLLAYALGAATSLALALLVSGRVFAAMKMSSRRRRCRRR